MMKRRVFIDIDGVLAKFNPDKSLEEVAMKGYSLSLEPQMQVVNAVRLLTTESIGLGCELYILGAYLNDDCKDDKNKWLDCFVPEIKEDHRIFVPYGTNKASHLLNIGFTLDETDILLDDFTKNLKSWHGVGVKLLNGINGTHGTWTGFVVNGRSDATTLAKALQGIIKVA